LCVLNTGQLGQLLLEREQRAEKISEPFYAFQYLLRLEHQ